MALSFVLAAAQPPEEQAPRTLDEFRSAAGRILREHGIPGAGIALVRADGVEWEGGIGLADRDRGIPVTADTGFRVGSISKTFVALAIVQLYYDDRLDLDADVTSVASEVAIDNPWHETHPVQVIHLLEHTAGFDDLRFRDLYNVSDRPDIGLLQVLERSASTRRVRWPPGTRMSYSNQGYAVLGYLIEKITGERYEEYIQREILDPLKMTASGFTLTPDDEAQLARGYRDAAGPSTGFPHIYYRPAGSLRSTPRDMGRFVRMLLNWGELDGEFVIDPEYLSNMERTSTTVAAEAGLRTGYGSGLAWFLDLPYPVLGHTGGIDGFSSAFGYSPSRDAGYVILLNSRVETVGRARDRLSALAMRYLKREVEPPVRPETRVDPALLETYAGYYQDASPRLQIMWPVQWFVAGRTIERDGDLVFMRGVGGGRTRLIPVTDTQFRRESEVDATLVFTRDAAGTMVLAGMQVYAERTPRWRVEIVRWPVAAALLFLLTPLGAAVAWAARVRVARPRGFWGLKGAILLCPIAIAAGVVALVSAEPRDLGRDSPVTIVVFLATLAVPALAVAIALLTLAAHRRGASRWLVGYAVLIVLAAAAVSAYLASHRLIGLRL